MISVAKAAPSKPNMGMSRTIEHDAQHQREARLQDREKRALSELKTDLKVKLIEDAQHSRHSENRQQKRDTGAEF